MSKLWLVFIAGPDSYDDIREMVEPIRDLFAGLVVTYHGKPDDIEAKYLEVVKGEGRIIYLPYSGRHNHSRNSYLWCGPIQQGDWCIQTDHLEHPNRQFIEKHVPYLTTQSNGIFYYYGKPFLFQLHESMQYVGSPHENLQRLDGQGRVAELSQMWPDESMVRMNVRPFKRKDPFGWCTHYAKYYIATPWGSNHCLLGNEHRGDPVQLYQEREALRVRFRDYLRDMDVPLTLDGLLWFMKTNPNDSVLVETANKERIINDLYRLLVLKDESIKDDHTWAGMVTIPLDTPTQST
jgi:hypothetical protein